MIKKLFGKPAVQASLPLLGLVVIVAFFAYSTNMRMLRPISVDLILSQVYVLMISSAGVFLVMTIGGLDLSQGSVMGLSSIAVSWLSFYSIPLAVAGGVAAGAFIGAFNGFFYVRFKIPSFIVTICTMFLFRGLCAYLTTNAPVAAVKEITSLNLTWLKLSLTSVFLLAVFSAFRFTKLGMVLKAVGAGEKAAYFSGVDTGRVKFWVFTAAGMMTGLAAFVNVVKVGSITATAGSQLETQILIALVLGGLPITGGAKARFSSVVVGSLIFCVLNNGLVMMGYDTAMQQLIKGIVFIIVVALTTDRKSLQVIK